MTIINLVKSPKGIISAEHVVENENITFLKMGAVAAAEKNKGIYPLMDPLRPGKRGARVKENI